MNRIENEIEPIDNEFAPPTSGSTPWQFLQDRLYGRWRYAIPLAVVTAMVGAFVGFLIAPAKYVATGFVEVQPTIQHVLSQTPEVVPMYDAMVETQAQIIQLDTVLTRALQGPKDVDESDIIQLKEMFSDLSVLRNALNVAREKKGTFVRVSVEADEPKPAYYMVRSILESYEDEVAPETEFEQKRNNIISLRTDEELKLSNAENARRGDKRASSNNYAIYSDEVLSGTLDLARQMLSDRVSLLSDLGVAVTISDFLEDSVTKSNTAAPPVTAEGNTALDPSMMSGEADTTEATGEKTFVDVIEPTLTELEEVDPLVRIYRSALNSESDRLDELRESLGNEHLSVRKQQARVNIASQRLRMTEESAIRLWHAERLGVLDDGSGLIDNASRVIDADEIIAEGRQLWKEIEAIDQELKVRLGIDQEIAKIEANLERINSSLENLEYNKQSLTEGRIEIRLPVIPTAPQKTKKRQMAIAGFLGGLVLPFGMFVLIGHVDRRAFGSKQIRGDVDSFDCLGVMPDLSRLESSPETRELTANCVHRLRNRLSLARGNGEHTVFAISSPFQGDGKTSVAFALAWSFASSGFKTVLVDTDFVGQSLTEQAGALNQLGFRDLLRGQRPNGEVRQIMDNGLLSVIGVGCDSSEIGPEGVTRTNVKELLEHLRDQFEITIIDTGPLLGSVEALPIVSAVDGVLLTLRRGRSKRRLDECAREIESVGSRLLGVVLNCADQSECRQYTSSSLTSARSVSRGPMPNSLDAQHSKRHAAVISMLGGTDKSAKEKAEPRS